MNSLTGTEAVRLLTGGEEVFDQSPYRVGSRARPATLLEKARDMAELNLLEDLRCRVMDDEPG